jgi:16S rRNA (guanine1207-N2)-methyltransferase
LRLVCQPDLPQDRIELAVLPFSLRGEAELTRELLQQACLRLDLDGTLVASVDNPQDHWLREQLQDLFEKVTVQRHDDATAYIARKTAGPRKVRDFRCEFAFRDRGRLIKAVTRPGVFSHRRLDAGARQLLNAVEVTPGMRILDIGCGAGTVALGLAARDPTATVHAVDSNARAIRCTLAAAELNALTNVTAELNATGSYGEDVKFDLAVANPPYYADHRIAELFLSAALRSLTPGGRVLIVAKRPDWYEMAMPGAWQHIQHWPSKRYHIIAAVRR